MLEGTAPPQSYGRTGSRRSHDSITWPSGELSHLRSETPGLNTLQHQILLPSTLQCKHNTQTHCSKQQDGYEQRHSRRKDS